MLQEGEWRALKMLESQNLALFCALQKAWRGRAAIMGVSRDLVSCFLGDSFRIDENGGIVETGNVLAMDRLRT